MCSRADKCHPIFDDEISLRMSGAILTHFYFYFSKNQNGSNGSSLWTPTSASPSSSVHHQPFILAPPPAGTASHGNHHHHHNSSSSSNNTNGSTSTGSPMKVPVKPPPLKSLPVIFSLLHIFVLFIYLFISTFLECITAFVWIRWRPNRSALSFRPGSQHGRPASSSAPDVAVQPGYSLALPDPIFSFNFVVTRLRWSGQWLVVFGWTSPPPTTTFFTSS
jgi:hypothetical protein